MGSRVFYDQMLVDECQHHQMKITDEVDVTNMQEYMQVGSVCMCVCVCVCVMIRTKSTDLLDNNMLVICLSVCHLVCVCVCVCVVRYVDCSSTHSMYRPWTRLLPISAVNTTHGED